MQTAMQELIERLETLSKKYQNAGLLTAIEIGNSLLEMEKQQIKDAWDNGAYGSGEFLINIETSQEYYNETYGSKGSADQVPDVRKMVDNWDNVFDKIESEYDCHIPLKVVNYLNKYYKVPTFFQTEISDCINCDETKPTHNICMDCVIKIGKQNQTEISDEEIEAYVSSMYYSLTDNEDEKEWVENHKTLIKMGANWYREQLKNKHNKKL